MTTETMQKVLGYEGGLPPTNGPHTIWDLLLALFVKYGFIALVCVYSFYNIREKDSELKEQNGLLLQMMQSQTVATTKNTEVLSGLGKIVEANTLRLQELSIRR